MTKFVRLVEGEIEKYGPNDKEVSFVVKPKSRYISHEGKEYITPRLHIRFPAEVLNAEHDLEMYIDGDNYQKLLAIMQG